MNTKIFNVKYVNSAMLSGKGKGFLEVEETVTEQQLERLKTMPFVHGLEYVYAGEKEQV